MRKKDLEKIEDILTDTRVPDSVLDIARAEMSKAGTERNSVKRKFNYKLVLSCAASLALCFAIILPVSLSLIKNKGDGGGFDAGDNDSTEAMPPAGDATAYYKLDELERIIIYPETGDNDHVSGDTPAEPQPPDADTESVVRLSRADYLYDGIKIIAEERYSIRDTECIVYIPYDLSFEVDVLEQFNNTTERYCVGSIAVKYKVISSSYFANTIFNGQKYCFKGSFAGDAAFQEFCGYLFRYKK